MSFLVERKVGHGGRWNTDATYPNQADAERAVRNSQSEDHDRHGSPNNIDYRINGELVLPL